VSCWTCFPGRSISLIPLVRSFDPPGPVFSSSSRLVISGALMVNPTTQTAQASQPPLILLSLSVTPMPSTTRRSCCVGRTLRPLLHGAHRLR